MPTTLPPEIANNAIRLYRECLRCLRRAKSVPNKQYDAELLVNLVRHQFKRHMHETDPEEIQKLKDIAAKGLTNNIFNESESS